MSISRRQALLATPFSLLAGSIADAAGPAPADAPTDLPTDAPADSPAAQLYPTQNPTLVREVVGASHARIDRVRELLAEHPALAKAAWDWGFGDWETALGAASHTGNREIAALLIEHGARPDIFTFAMLGQLDVVRAFVAASPGIQRLHGPHGITLLKHAEAGGESSAPVVEFLKQLGDADVGQVSRPLPPEWSDRYLGEYAYGPGPSERFSILAARRGGLAIRRGADGNPLQLFHQGDHAFHPTGAPAVAIRFDVQGESVTGLRVTDGPVRVVAARVPR